MWPVLPSQQFCNAVLIIPYILGAFRIVINIEGKESLPSTGWKFTEKDYEFSHQVHRKIDPYFNLTVPVLVSQADLKQVKEFNDNK